MADALWSIFERKIERAQDRGTVDRIPAIRIVDRAADPAREIPRRNVVIPMTES